MIGANEIMGTEARDFGKPRFPSEHDELLFDTGGGRTDSDVNLLIFSSQFSFGRAYFQGLEGQKFTAKDISDFMRFIDTDVNFSLDIQEIR